jgi:hypothetical protein
VCDPVYFHPILPAQDADIVSDAPEDIRPKMPGLTLRQCTETNNGHRLHHEYEPDVMRAVARGEWRDGASSMI